jgi:hypothetical protein
VEKGTLQADFSVEPFDVVLVNISCVISLVFDACDFSDML